MPNPIRLRPTLLAIDDSKSQCAFYRIVLGRFGKVRTVDTLDEFFAMGACADLIILATHLVGEGQMMEDVLAKLTATAPVLLSEAYPQDRAARPYHSERVVGHWRRGGDHEHLCWLVERALGSAPPAVLPAPTYLCSSKGSL